MLNFKKIFKLQKQALASAYKNMNHQPLMTILTSIMIGFILTWPTFLWILSNQTQQAIDDWQNKAYFTFYLPSQVNEQVKNDILQRLQSMPNLKSVNVITPQNALKRLLKDDDAKTLNSLNLDNPLPYVIEIQPQTADFNAQTLALFYKKISQIPYLQGSKDNLTWFQRLAAIQGFLNRFSMLLLLILVMGVAFLISNTLRMVIHSRYEEIQVLKLVGATNRFILAPFLYTGAAYSFLGALFAIMTVDISIGYLQAYFQPLADLYHYAGGISFISFAQSLRIMFLSLILGWGAAWIFVRHYLKAIEPI
jgi:cell division transport system permease protein